MRIRFYAARASDGLPNDTAVLLEQAFLNPSRIWTGRILGNQKEYIYESSLPSSLALAAETKYWIEVVQVGDADSYYRREYSLADLNGRAFKSALTSDWQQVGTNDLAFQLSNVPEPGTALLATIVTILIMRRHPGTRRCR
jgi:hypothetical protein